MPRTLAPIRVLLVDDSPLSLALQARLLARASEIEIVGTAAHGGEALALLEKTPVDVICTDVLMPTMSGLELVRHVMARAPRPILAVSTSSGAHELEQLRLMLEAGALDVFPKPAAVEPFEPTARLLIEKIRVLAGVYVFSRANPDDARALILPLPTKAATRKDTSPNEARETQSDVHATNRVLESDRVLERAVASEARRNSALRVVAIGASTGGPQVLREILSALPARFPCPVLCVQHISAGFLTGLVDWLHASCALRVKIMEEGEQARAGTVYFPPEGRHMTLDAHGFLRASSAAPIGGHRPSATVMFQSLAQNHGNAVLAILLTGMGDDGARGLLEVRRAGGQTIAQCESSCVVFGMPRAAIALEAAQQVLSVSEIGAALQRHVPLRFFKKPL